LGGQHFLSKNFEILENFGNFWKFLENFDKILEKCPGGKKFWKFLEIFAKIFENCKKLEI
jgi:hypothetical protein